MTANGAAHEYIYKYNTPALPCPRRDRAEREQAERRLTKARSAPNFNLLASII